MKLIKRFGVLFSTLLLAVACSSGGDEAPEPVALATPMPSVEVQGAIVSITWTPIEHAASYSYELYKNGSLSETKSLQIPSFSYRMEGENNYGFRVKAVADNSGLYLDSEWSGTIQNQLGKLASTTAQIISGSLTSSSVAIKWVKITNAVKYHYQLLQAGAVVKEDEVTTTEVEFTELKAGTEYKFKVKGLSDGSSIDSNYSSELTFTTQEPMGDNPLGLPENERDGVIRAFPGAEGGGMYTTGGRGGKVIHVTNLNDSGTGSLRAAINQSGKRIIVFDVAGTITLKSDLEIGYGDLTIAGQTAPGDGICIKGGTVQIKASNLIIRFVRFRMGDESSFASDGSDASWGRYYQDIILDHNSYSWSIDEVASFYANKNFTMQWCTVGEGLTNSVHGKGSHGYGGIWGGKNASFHHNLLIHNNSRNPRFCHPQVYSSYLSTHRGNVDYRNNVIYNWGDNSTYGGESGQFNMVGNYYKPGPASKDRKYFLAADAFYEKEGKVWSTAYPKLYLDGNKHTKHSDLTANNKLGVNWTDGNTYSNYNQYQSIPFAIKKDDVTTCFTSTHTADDAYAHVLDYAGASLRRDAVDKRYIDDARNGKATCMSGSNGSKNGLIDSQNDAGGWPTLSATSEEINRATTDTDKDGIPDYYEEQLGLDKNKAADGAEKTLDPQGLYSNFEIYLHYLVKDIIVKQTAGATYKSLN